MIITRTPFRVSFFGGGTDYPPYYREHGGAVLATTIDKYCYISLRYLPPFFDYKSRVLYSKVEEVRSNEEIQHPAVREALKFMGIEKGVEIHHDGDLPARTGLGSSSSFSVGMLHAAHALKNSIPTKMQLAREAIHLEQDILKENVGCQDQLMAAWGGLQLAEFLPNDQIRVSPVTVGRRRIAELESHLMLFFTGFQRIASVIVKEQLDRIPDTQAELKRMRELVDEGLKALASPGGFLEFGRLLDESWAVKKRLSSKISMPVIDEAYDAAKACGALGGKLLGAGGGGFMLLFAPPGAQPRIRERLKRFLYVPFRFESEGTRIITYQPDEYDQ